MAADSSDRSFLFRSWPYFVAAIAFIGYCLWIGWPYITSVVVRDAAVTSWSNVVTSPIRGEVRFESISIGKKIGRNGLIAEIRNSHVSTKAVSNANLRVQLAKARVSQVQAFMDSIKSLEQGRRELKAHYANLFRAQLDTQILQYEGEIAVVKKRLATIGKIVSRSEKLAKRGVASQTAADEARLRQTELELDLVSKQSKLRDARERRAAANKGVFLEANGEDPPWVRGNRIELKVEKKQAHADMLEAEAQLKVANAELDNARMELMLQNSARVRAPPNGLLWRKLVASNMTVQAGDPVAEWIDCDQLMIDMPVSDAEAALILPGEAAEVVLEGDSKVHAAAVVLVRGAASTLGRSELVALAKGRRKEHAQVILRLSEVAADFSTCPVGRSAYVDFPGIGVIDIIRSRLRL